MSNQLAAPVPVERIREKHVNTAEPNIAGLHYDYLIDLALICQSASGLKSAKGIDAEVEGFLMIFDQRAKPVKWEKRTPISQAKTESGRTISVFRG